MKVLDLYSGTRSSTAAFEAAGHEVITVERDTKHTADYHYDIGLLTVDDLRRMCRGTPDFVWASPPCTAFSVASIGHHWASGGDDPQPKTKAAREAQGLVVHTLGLIEGLGSRFWLMENPRGMLRKLAFMRPYDRHTVTYCQYGDERQKPTDLWGRMPSTWTPRPMCKPGASCHVAAPRGAKTGTQGRTGAVDRSRVPFGLSLEVLHAITAAGV